MKKVLSGLVVLVVMAAAAAVYALRAGWLTAPTDVPAPSPSAAPVVIASPSATVIVQKTPSPLPARDRRILRLAVDDRAAALLFVALPQFIKNHGGDLNVQCVVVPNAALRWQMLAAGSVDLACGTFDSWVLAASRHDAGAMLFKTAASAGFDTLVAKDITDIRSLGDKRIAVVGGEGGLFLLGFFLNSRDMLPSQVHIVDVEDAHDALELLHSGRVAAACLWQPYVAAVLRETGMKALATTAAHPLVDEVCAVNRSTLSERHKEVMIFVRYWFEQQAQLQVNGGWGSEMIARDSGRPPAEVAEQLKSIRLYTIADNRKIDVRDVGNDITHLQDFWRVVGVPNANRPIDIEHAVKIDLTRDVEVSEPTPLYGSPEATSRPADNASPAASSEPATDDSGEPASSPEESPQTSP